MRKNLNLLIFFSLVACSSTEEIRVDAGNSSALENVKIFQRDDSEVMQNALIGTLPFFYGGAKGLSLSGIKWNEPVSAENPGVDCDLTYVSGKTSSHFFRCIIREGEAHIIVSLQEDILQGRRLLRRVFMDGRGKEVLNQWGTSLERMGYRKTPGKALKNTVKYLSGDGKTQADLIFVPASSSVTLRIYPK